MTYISWTDNKCPRCKTLIDRHLGGRDAVGLRIGVPYVTCRKCQLRMSTGSKEWSDFTHQERRNYLFPTVDKIIVLAGVAITLLAGSFQLGSFIFILIGLLVYSVVPLSKLLAIRSSEKRARSSQAEGK